MFTGSSAPPTAHEHTQLQQQAQESASESTEVEVDEENGDEEDERLPNSDERLASSAAIPPSLDFDSSSPAAPSGSSPGSSPDPSPQVVHPSLQGGPDVLGLAHPLFTISQLGVDRRLLVNRKRQLKMYRVWMQGKFQRTEADGSPPAAGPHDAGTS